MTLWTEIRALITDGEVDRLADRLIALTDDERAELAARLPGLPKELRGAKAEELHAEYPAIDDFVIRWQIDDALRMISPGLLLAGVGVIGGPAAAVTWLTSRAVNPRWGPDIDVEQVCRVAAARPVAWRRDVAVRLARRIRRPGDRIVPLAIALLRASGAVPPADHDPLVAAWLSAPIVPGDPLLPVLLPRVFTAEGVGRVLRDQSLKPEPSHWLAATAREVPRRQALDGCVSRFLRGGEAQDLRFFVRLHTLLDPTPAESAARLRDYLRLLPATPGPVAELAAGRVRACMPLDHADLVEAVDALTFRAEAKLAATGLRWLDRALRATPEAAGDFVPALVTAYAHTSFDVRTRAVELTLRHAALFDGHAEAIRDGLQHLPADQGARLAARFGGQVRPEERERKEFPPLPEPPRPERFPEPSLHPDSSERWVNRERWLAGFVRGIAADRGRLCGELKPWAEDGLHHHWRSEDDFTDPDVWQRALAAEIVTPGSLPEVPPPAPETAWDDASHSVSVRVIPRGAEPPPEPQAGRGFLAVSHGGPQARYLDDDSPLRIIDIIWDSDEGPAGAVAREGGQEIPFDGHRVRLNDLPDDEPAAQDDERPHPGFEPPDGDHAAFVAWDVGGAVYEAIEYLDRLSRSLSVRSRPGVRYDDSVEAMPSYILDDAYERMAELGVAPARIEAMREGRPVPPPAPDEPLVQVTVSFIPPRLRSFMPQELPEAEEWRRRNRLPHPGDVAPPHDFLLHRYAEIAQALRDGTLPPVLLATPTWTSGHLDPDMLVDRLESCAAAGVEPLPADLAQALLRLPRGGHPEAAARAARIGSEAARSVVRWLEDGGMADPETGHTWQHMVGASTVDLGEDEPESLTGVSLRPVLRVTRPTGHRLIDEVLLREPPSWLSGWRRYLPDAWAMLPSHREVVAVQALHHLLQGSWDERLHATDVRPMALGQGPLGESSATILAFLLAGQVPGTLPLLLGLAARGELPAEDIGRRLALVLRRTWREPRTAFAALTELAEAGAHHEVWRILLALLPAMLPDPASGTARRVTTVHTTLVALAADVAGWTGARGEIPVIAGYARSGRKSRFAHECARLHALLTATT
ncbi:DUF6493 family protein [Nonomuraea fastidiosa]|uniref:DUF7824 domain-containing protein n=1 Tax=Nonomuraea fastidiosa TaxID=46173 RepID=UPI00366FCFA1